MNTMHHASDITRPVQCMPEHAHTIPVQSIQGQIQAQTQARCEGGLCVSASVSDALRNGSRACALRTADQAMRRAPGAARACQCRAGLLLLLCGILPLESDGQARAPDGAPGSKPRANGGALQTAPAVAASINWHPDSARRAARCVCMRHAATRTA